MVSSSAPLDHHTTLELKERFPGLELMNSYGLTEASTCTVLPHQLVMQRPGAIGFPVPPVDMSIVDADGQEVEPGCEGELRVRGDHVFLGYFGQPRETSAAFEGGWLRTGDLGHRDADGCYYLHGRSDDIINRCGSKVAPEEVENCILTMPEVAEAAIVGVPSQTQGEQIKAFVVARAGKAVDPRRVIRHCAGQLASYKVPAAVEVVAALPKNALGKTVRALLQTGTRV
jgi:long-chain acyl-CoA synthetase